MLRFAKQLVLAVLRPRPPAFPQFPARALLRLPVLFDLTTLILQARDQARLSRIADAPAAPDPHLRAVFDHNASRTRDKRYVFSRATERLLFPLAACLADPRDASVLMVGPRTVNELYLAWLHGFSWRNISGIDLYSTNPKISVMNMEAMNFPDASFDVVVSSKTVGYASDAQTCLGEFHRVLKPGGHLFIDCVYRPGVERFAANRYRGDDYWRILHGLGFTPVYYRSVDGANVEGEEGTVHYLGVRKPPSEAQGDRIGFAPNAAPGPQP